jgi:solute:Na+ symporter, SSS family
LRSANLIDYVVITVYMVFMLGIGVYFMRFNKGASDYFRGGNRIPWIVAALSSFMSGFSAWTFTGAAGVAYREGVAAVALYVGNACSFLLGYWIFAALWRRARISTTMEYLSERYDQRTRQAFSWTTVFFQLFMGASMLYGLGLFVASTCHLPILWTILISGLIILLYCMVGGLWAVVVTDFLQAVILMPFCIVLVVTSLAKVGGIGGFLHSLPPALLDLRLPGEFGWVTILAWTVMVSFGYNTAAMAQRYFSVDNEDSARKAALLCFVLFLLGAFIWFVPPMAMRILHPDLSIALPGMANPHEATYALASLTLLPNGLIGIMLAAMFSATMSSLSGLFNLHSAILTKDVYQTLFKKNAGEKRLLAVGWISTCLVGLTITLLAAWLAASKQSIFAVMLTFNTIISLAYGPPALLGLVVKRTPSWSGLASFGVSLILGCAGSFFYHWTLVQNVAIIIPVSVGIFLLSRWVGADDPDHQVRCARFFERLNTPVDVRAELEDSVDMTTPVFRFLSRTTSVVGLLSLLLVFSVDHGDRLVVVAYASITLALAGLLTLIRGQSRRQPN